MHLVPAGTNTLLPAEQTLTFNGTLRKLCTVLETASDSIVGTFTLTLGSSDTAVQITRNSTLIHVDEVRSDEGMQE